MRYAKYTINGVGLNLAETGDPENDAAIVFLHYFGGSARTWGPVMERLAGPFRCLAPDARGWGDSDAPPMGYTVAAMADDVGRLIAALGLTRYTLVGHSMGGKAAQALAALHPAGLERMLLAAPSPLSPEPMTEEARAKMRAGWGREEAARETLKTIAKLPLGREVEEAVIADTLRASRVAWESWADEGSREDLSALAAKIEVPTHVLVGAADLVLPPDVLRREVVEKIAGATLTVVPRAGHLLPLEDAAAVAGWVQKEAGRGRGM